MRSQLEVTEELIDLIDIYAYLFLRSGLALGEAMRTDFDCTIDFACGELR